MMYLRQPHTLTALVSCLFLAGVSALVPSAVQARPLTVGLQSHTSLPSQMHTGRSQLTVGLSWRQPTVLPEALSRPAVAVGHDGNIYVFGGGISGGQSSSATFIYHPGSNAWTEGASMPTARQGLQAVTLPDGRIAVLGGGTNCFNRPNFGEICQYGTVYNEVDVYDPRTNTWGTLPPMQTAHYRFGAALYQGRIYVVGGTDGSVVMPRVEVYDFQSKQWTYGPPLPQPLLSPMVSVDGRGHLDVMGGFDGTSGPGRQTYKDLYVFDGMAWRSGASMLQATEDSAAALAPDGQIYVIGGYEADYLNTVQAYDVARDSWSTAPSLPAPLCCNGTVVVPTGQIYVLGGSGPDNTVEEYGPTVSLSAVYGQRGARLAARGDGFAADTYVLLYWGKAGSHLLGIGLTDASGSLRQPIQFTIPWTVSVGQYQITAVDVLSRYPVNTTLTVTN